MNLGASGGDDGGGGNSTSKDLPATGANTVLPGFLLGFFLLFFL